MPNVNFTSSSIAQQDRFAQTTVSYESRNMQAIPFYPDVDHKAKFRGILVLTLIWSVVIGAVFGLIYGYRDVIFAAAESVGTAWFGGDREEETAAAVDSDEKINFSLAESADDSNITNEYIEAQKKVWNFVYPFRDEPHNYTYDGTPKAFDHWKSPLMAPASLPYPITVTFSYLKNDQSESTPTVIVNDNDWPTAAGTYVVWVTAEAEGETYSYTTVLTINKATQADIPYPGLVYPQNGTVYDTTEKTLGIKNDADVNKLGIANSVGYDIFYKSKPEDDYKLLTNGNAKVLNAGYYKVIIKIAETKNTKACYYDDEAVEFTIKKAKFPSISDYNTGFTDKTFTYNGNAHEIKINANGFTNTFPAELKAFIDDGNVSYEYVGQDGVEASNNKAINAGIYYVYAHINHNNYENATFSAKLTVEKAKLTNFFTFSNTTMVYNGQAPADSLLYINGKNFPSSVYVEYAFERVDKKETGLNPANIISAGTYRITATFSYKKDAHENYVLPDGNTATRTLTVKKADFNRDSVSVGAYTDTYTGSFISFPKENITVSGLPANENITIRVTKGSFSDAGTYDVEFTLSGANYNTATITAEGKMVINKASFGNLLNINVSSSQQIKKDGKEHLPTAPRYSFNNGFEPTELDTYFIFAGKEISVGGEGGPSKLGEHKLTFVISDKNHEDRYDIVYTIGFNPLSIVMGIVLGIVLGFIIALLILAGYRGLEKRSFNNFKGVRLRLQHERGGDRGAIVCEGRVMIINWNSENEHRDFPWIVEPRFGRLFLTHATLEYYDGSCSGRNIKSYKNYRNFLIQLKEVTGVEIRGTFFRSKLIVFARGARHVFYVEPNTAYLWRRDIMHFRDLAHLYPMENNVVDNNYPFNYTLIKSEDRDPNVPDNI